MIVTVKKYDPDWIEDFKTESQAINQQIGEFINHIHHIGSTAVPELMAKPIIDIMLDVKSVKALDNQSSKLEDLGYQPMGEFGIKGRRYFRKGGDNRTHQIHAFKQGDANLLRHLAFRDYLINHKRIAEQYGHLKVEIAERCKNDIEKYSKEKDSFIKHYEAVAIEWYSKNIP